MMQWLANKLAEALLAVLTGQPLTECKYKRRCGPDDCECWADEQKKRRADLDKQERTVRLK